jgi:DNA-binding CsgD family transcriptional regulator/tetratricopeptide (TPR) repeat protein
MLMAVTPDLEKSRQSFERGDWGQAYGDLSAHGREGSLEIEDLERLAVAACMVGRDDESADAWMRAYQEWLRRGEVARAARCAAWQACGLLFRGELAPAWGWIGRLKRVLEGTELDCVERGWLLALTAFSTMFQGDPGSAYSRFMEAGDIAERFNDPDLMVFAGLGRGQASIHEQRVADGMGLLDEVMISVLAAEASPVMVGIAYCTVISVCHTVFDLRRAREWTEALSRWCDAQPDLVPYRGNCLVHRSEIFQLQGAWPDALKAAQLARDWLSGPTFWDSLASAYYQLGEIQRLRGQFDDAEAAYRSASEAGREPEPGMSLLRLQQGRIRTAAVVVRRILNETEDAIGRSKVLPAAVDIFLSAGDLQSARVAADELGGIADATDAPYLRALASNAAGSVLLSEGDARAALVKLRAAYASWRDLDCPYESARARVVIGLACRELGDEATAGLELHAARKGFEQLEAIPDVDWVTRLLGEALPGATALSPREREVIVLVASGKTNRAIATELSISEKTVARHISNIFSKVGLSSRAAVTAYAYEHGLV